MNDERPTDVQLDVTTYEAAGGLEHFISFEDFDRDLLVGFARLRFPSYSHAVEGSGGAGGTSDSGEPIRRELRDAALLRELHVYGSEVGLDAGETPTSGHQHRGYGRRLMAEAERLAREAGFRKLSVIAGIGAREYYREKLGYHQDGPYVSTRL